MSACAALYSICFSKQAIFSSIYFVVLEVRKIAPLHLLKIRSNEFLLKDFLPVNFALEYIPWWISSSPILLSELIPYTIYYYKENKDLI